VCAQLPNPQLLIAPSLAKEAQATSALEGTYGALPDVVEARLPGFEPKRPEIREIHAYERMARHAFQWVHDRHITIGMLCDLQRVLAEASRHPSRDPGRVRRDQVRIGAEDCTVYDARFIPPPASDHLAAGLDAWQEWSRVAPGGDQVGAVGMAEVVEPDVGHASLPCCPPVEGPADGVRVERLAGWPTEDEVVVLPARSDEQAALGLDGRVPAEDTEGLGVQIERPAAVVGLRALPELESFWTQRAVCLRRASSVVS